MSTPALRDLLDEAADRALVGAGGPDPQAALVRAAERRRDALVRRARVLLAAALVVFVAASGAWLAGWPHRIADPAAPGTPRGLPDRWWTPPLWTPLVTDEPVEAASLLLDTPVHPAFDDPGGDLVIVSGAVVVSADGRRYRRLPLRPGASSTSLSPSGRQVAWLETDVADPQPDDTLLVVLELATGRTSAVPLSGSAARGVISWFPGDEALAVTLDAAEGRIGWRVDVGRPPVLLCRCGADGVVLVDPTGAPRTAGDVTFAEGTTPLREPAGGDVVVSPDGRRAARIDAGVDALVVTDATGRVVRSALPAGLQRPVVLAWTRDGVLVTSRPDRGTGGELWRVDPDTGRSVRVSTGSGQARVVAVARDLVSGPVVRGAPPSTRRWARAYVRDVLDRPDAHPVTRAALVAGGAIGVVAVAAAVLLAVGLAVGRVAGRALDPASRARPSRRPKKSPPG